MMHEFLAVLQAEDQAVLAATALFMQLTEYAGGIAVGWSGNCCQDFLSQVWGGGFELWLPY